MGLGMMWFIFGGSEPMTVGQLIAKRLREMGMRQAQLARKMMVSRTTVSDWVRDKHAPRFDTIPQLAAILEVDPATLSPVIRAVQRLKRIRKSK